MKNSRIDVVGIGLNATDTVIRVRVFPALGGKERLLSSSMQAGGQIATALVTCQRLGLRSRYVGKMGDDAGGLFQLASLRSEGLDLQFARVARGTPNQLAYIIVDEATGERTVFWDRHPHLAMAASELRPEVLRGARALLIDGCDVETCYFAAQWARAQGIPVVADLDTVYKKVEKLFPLIDYLVASANFLPTLTGDNDPFRVLKYMAKEYHMPAPGMTLGRDGALVLWRGRFHYSPGFVVETVDTTGAGDVFHGAFVYGLVSGWAMERILDFSNAMAGLNCTALGARGGIATRAQAQKLVKSGQRHVNRTLQRGG
ncbi:MAG TPA: PfkB family carbohydrate kinase [Terriglobia bacterium]|nr:PfkB family carbohydrate kinase [Terriglobia bacterium]